MLIKLESKNVVTKQGKTGKPYKALEIKYAVGNKGDYPKTIFSFGEGKPVFDVLSTSDATWFEITEVQKGNYRNWTNAVPSEPKNNPSPKSNYETAEEREYRQLRIVRQSSLSNAVALLTLRGDKKVDEVEVIRIAEVFVDYVQNGLESAAMGAVEAMEDDIPF